jgi:hypothetical protein
MRDLETVGRHLIEVPTKEKNFQDHMILLTRIWIMVFIDIRNWCERSGNWVSAQARHRQRSAIHEVQPLFSGQTYHMQRMMKNGGPLMQQSAAR